MSFIQDIYYRQGKVTNFQKSYQDGRELWNPHLSVLVSSQFELHVRTVTGCLNTKEKAWVPLNTITL